MKLCWFHLMPYRHLPEDFEEKYRSVWVDVPSHLFDPVKANQLYNEYLDELEFADQVGFDGICINEHHNNAYGIMPSPNITAATLTRRTKDAAIVVLGNSLALYNPPLRGREEFAMLDCISGGRLVAGFPVGTSMDTNYAYGATPASLREKYYEAHDLVMKAWTEPEPFAFNGKHNQVRYVNIWPRPLQDPHPPVWIPGGGSVETWEWTARMDYVYCYLSYFGYKRGIQVMDGFWKEMERLGVDDTPTAPASSSLSASPRPTRRPRNSTPNTLTSSTKSASTSMRASPKRPATAPSAPSSPARSSRSEPPPAASGSASPGKTTLSRATS